MTNVYNTRSLQLLQSLIPAPFAVIIVRHVLQQFGILTRIVVRKSYAVICFFQRH